MGRRSRARGDNREHLVCMVKSRLLVKGHLVFGKTQYFQELGEKPRGELPPGIPGIVALGRDQGANRAFPEFRPEFFRDDDGLASQSRTALQDGNR